MINIIENISVQIKKIISEAIQKISTETDEFNINIEEIEIEKPRDKNNGDFSTNIAMQLSRIFKKSPANIAQELIDKIQIKDTYIEKVEKAGPGFINFYLSSKWLHEVIYAIEEHGNNYGRTNIGKGQKVMVEFISANPTGPMHMGNARGGALGDCLAGILEWTGHDVTREFYINDAGNQIERFEKSLEARYIQQTKGIQAVEFPEDGYHGQDIIDRVKEFIQIQGDKYINKPQKEITEALVEYALEKNISKLKTDLESYGIKYDVWFRESTLYKNNEVQDTINYLIDKGYTYTKEGAIWFKASEFGAEKDEVLVRNNGIPTYFTADIAYHRNKFITRGFDKVIDIWGADHHGHVQRMKGAMEAIACNPDKLNIIIMQLVRLLRQGELARMSKRTGQAVTLSDLLEETSKDAARFFFNMRQANSHLDFDLDLAVAESNENPVYYIQYAHARICSIINLLKQEGIHIKAINKINLNQLSQTEEIDILKKLAELPEEIKTAAILMEPSRMTRYLLDLAGLFHTFYSSCRVKVDQEELMQARLKLIDSVRIVIKNVLNMLGISAPEKM